VGEKRFEQGKRENSQRELAKVGKPDVKDSGEEINRKAAENKSGVKSEGVPEHKEVV